MNNTLRVLSVDWDYFVDCTADYRYMNFPDGGNENIGGDLSDMVWAVKYAETSDLDKLDVLKDEYKCLKELFKSLSDKAVPFYYYDSHMWAYQVITSKALEITPGSIIEVTNIDFHHDFYNFGESSEVNCGNWQRRLDETLSSVYGMNYTWVCRSDSDTDEWNRYCFESDYQHNIVGLTNKPSFQDVILNHDYDVVFVCRSRVWSPPHLDHYLVSLLSDVNYRGERLADRYTESYKESIVRMKPLYQNFMK